MQEGNWDEIEWEKNNSSPEKLKTEIERERDRERACVKGRLCFHTQYKRERKPGTIAHPLVQVRVTVTHCDTAHQLTSANAQRLPVDLQRHKQARQWASLHFQGKRTCLPTADLSVCNEIVANVDINGDIIVFYSSSQSIAPPPPDSAFLFIFSKCRHFVVSVLKA